MKPRTLILVGFVEIALLLVGVYYEPTCSVRGRLRGEPFFEGKSATWWSYELESWHTYGFGYYRSTCPNRFGEITARIRNPFKSNEDIQIERAFASLDVKVVWPDLTLMNGDPDAHLVLAALLDDPSPKVRRFARIGLKLESADP